jgi:hypothetical protein
MRCDGAPRGWPAIPMAWASTRGIASKCRWPLRRGSSTRVGGGTSVAPPSQERPTPAAVTARRALHRGPGSQPGPAGGRRGRGGPGHLAGVGRAWLRRDPGLLRQPAPSRPTTSSPGSSSSRRQRPTCSASNEDGLAGGASHQAAWQPQQLLAQVGPPAPEGPCACHLQAAVDGLQAELHKQPSRRP